LIVQPNARVSAFAISRPFVIASIARRGEQHREVSRENR
jgi:hypothetical protein